MDLSELEGILPGETSSRINTLNKLRSKVMSRGVEVLPISQSDIECFWITVRYKGTEFRLGFYEELDIYLEAIDNGKL